MCVCVLVFICGALMKCATGLFSYHYLTVVSLLRVSGNFSDTLLRRCFQVGCKKNFAIKHTIHFASQNCCIHTLGAAASSFAFVYLFGSSVEHNFCNSIDIHSNNTTKANSSNLNKPHHGKTFKYSISAIFYFQNMF